MNFTNIIKNNYTFLIKLKPVKSRLSTFIKNKVHFKEVYIEALRQSKNKAKD